MLESSGGRDLRYRTEVDPEIKEEDGRVCAGQIGGEGVKVARAKGRQKVHKVSV